MTRIEMIEQLSSLSNGNVDSELFNEYIPKYYAQIYSLYSLLNECRILSGITFLKPIVIADTITINFLIPNKKYNKLKVKINYKNGILKYLRDYSFNIELINNDNIISLKFIKV